MGLHFDVWMLSTVLVLLLHMMNVLHIHHVSGKCRPPIEEYQVPLSSLLGQPAFSNSTFRQSDLRTALHRLQSTKSKLRHKLKPTEQAGQGVVNLLQVTFLSGSILLYA